MDNQTCVICKAGFPTTKMKGNKCYHCAELYPTAESAKELQQNSTKNKAETLTDVTVRKMVYEILEEAGIKRFKCDDCGALYFKTSPAQKVCVACREKKAK